MIETSDRTFAEIYRNLNLADFVVAYPYVEQLVKNWDRDGKLLDMGFGAERSIKHLRSLGFNHITGMDSNWHMNAQAMSKGKIAQMQGNKLGFASDSFDYVSIQNVLQDISDYSILIGFLNEASRVVRSGGKILIMNPTPDSYKVDTENFKCSEYPENHDAISRGMGAGVKVKIKDNETVFIDRVWRKEDLKSAFKEADLKIEKYKEPYWMLYELSVKK